MPDAPNVGVPSQQAGDPSVNAPPSGVYGEGQALDNLKASLPVGNVGNPGQQAPGPPPVSQQGVNMKTSPGGRPSTGVALPNGLPGVLAGPTTMPHVPVSTPLAPPSPGGAPPPSQGSPQADRKAILFALTTNPGVSQDTRQWASSLLAVLNGQQ